jgi:hypothetical protein
MFKAYCKISYKITDPLYPSFLSKYSTFIAFIEFITRFRMSKPIISEQFKSDLNIKSYEQT